MNIAKDISAVCNILKNLEKEGAPNSEEMKRAFNIIVKAFKSISPCELIAAIPGDYREQLIKEFPICLSDIWHKKPKDEQLGYADVIIEDLIAEAIEALRAVHDNNIKKVKESMKTVIEYATNALIEIGGSIDEAHKAVEAVRAK